MTAAEKHFEESFLMLRGGLTIVIAEAVQSERERCAKLIEGWSGTKAGKKELVRRVRSGGA